MPPAANKGQLFECRLARLLAAEGAFVRRRVNLDAHFGERFTITDIDVLALFFSPTLELRTVAGECKTTEAKSAPSAGDRLMWSTGLGRLAHAEQTFVAISKRARESERNVASLVGSEIVDIRDLERREELQKIESSEHFGPHDPKLTAHRRAAMDLAKADEELRRLQRFVISELWLAPAIPKLKKALGAARRLSERWSPGIPAGERGAVGWMLAESVTGAIVALTQLAGVGYRQPEDMFAQYLHERLAEGLADYHSLRAISRQIDKVLTGVLPTLGVDASRAVEVMGFFEPKAPTYTEPLGELLERLAREPAAAAKLARLADSRYAVFLGADGAVEGRLGDIDATSRLLRLIAAFLQGQVRIPEPLLEPLRGVSATAPDAAVQTGANGHVAGETRRAALFE